MDLIGFQRGAKHGRIATVTVLPEVVADQDHALGARSRVSRRKVAPEHGPLADERKRVRGHPLARYPFRKPIVTTEVRRHARVAREVSERAGLFRPVEKIGIGDAHLLPAGGEVPGIEMDDFVGIFKRQALYEYRVDETEHRGVQADSNRKRRQRHQRDGGVLDHGPQAEPYISKNSHRNHLSGSVRTADRSSSVNQAEKGCCPWFRLIKEYVGTGECLTTVFESDPEYLRPAQE